MLPALLLAVLLAVWVLAYYLPLRRLHRRLLALNFRDEPQSERLNPLDPARDLARLFDRIVEEQNVVSRRAEEGFFDLRAILSSMKEGVVLVDTVQRIRMVNEEISRILPKNLSPINRTPLELFRNHLLHRTIEKSFESAGPQMIEITFDILESGVLVCHQFEVTITSLRAGESGQSLGALAVFHDISRIKALEGMRKEFVANVSHELRTPLSIITGYLETLLEDNFDDPIASRKFLRVMQKHTQRLHLLVEDLLIISQLESQKVSLRFENMSLPVCLAKVAERLDSEAQVRGATIRLAFPPDFPPVEGDEHRIDQVFFNLLDNAVKYIGGPGRKISVSGEVLGQNVRVSVRDQGPGIAQEHQPHIFERFYRVDRARSRNAGGTGLGLSIVKHVVQAHGGSVDIESELGKGSTFHVTLPLRQAGESGS